jgi:hypothetical protein
MPPLTVSTTLWHSLRLFIFGKLSMKIRELLIKKKDMLKSLLGLNLTKMSKVLNIIALILGAIAYAIISKIIDKILMTFLPLKKMNSLDEFWLYDDKDSLSNVSALFSLEKTKFEVI